jgi:hypothetical protein
LCGFSLVVERAGRQAYGRRCEAARRRAHAVPLRLGALRLGDPAGVVAPVCVRRPRECARSFSVPFEDGRELGRHFDFARRVVELDLHLDVVPDSRAGGLPQAFVTPR